MKFQITDAFTRDLKALKPEHRAAFREIIRTRFVPACEAYARDRATPWPKALRVKAVKGADGVLEMTWSFASPDGRATFEFIQLDGELCCRWRRVGDHSVFLRP